MKISEITGVYESPSLMGSSDFEFNNKAFNIKRAKELLADKQEPIKENDRYEFFRTGDTHDGEFVVVTKTVPRMISYYVNYQQSNYEKLGTTVTQVMLWRAYGKPMPSNITNYVFFGILLKRWKTVVSDSAQTPEGRKFWMGVMNLATVRNYRIGLIDVSTDEIQWYDKKSNVAIDDWAEDLDAWGQWPKFSKLRFIISKIKI